MPTSTPLEVHFLDVGSEKYGDSILVRYGEKTILIDGAHRGNFNGTQRYPSIPTQLAEILGDQTPHELSLLVLTHAHNDHIGCLPELVSEGIITARKAYVADVALGWGQHTPDALPDASDPTVGRILAILREGAGATLRADNPEQAIADVMKLKDRYTQMLDTLVENGTELIFCTGDEDRSSIEAEFPEIGFKILGPSKSHLTLCADQIASLGRDAIDAVNRARAGDASISDAALLEEVLDAQEEAATSFLADMWGTGSALNCQSIVLALTFHGKKVLLAGDMQFAKSEVDELDAEMDALREAVANNGPYHINKTTHHTSYNGLDQSVLDQQIPFGEAFFLVHTGGVNDSHHPESSCLSLLRNLRRTRDDFTWLRVDRNGKISFSIDTNGEITFQKSKGRLNTFTANEDVVPEPSSPLSPPSPPPPESAKRLDADQVEVITRVPHVQTKVTVTIEIAPPTLVAQQPSGGGGGSSEQKRIETPPPDPLVRFQLPTDRSLPPLLFVTDEQALGRKIGSANARAAIAAIRSGGHQVIADQRLAGLSALAAAERIRPYLDGVEGVVLVGSGDVVPALRLDVLNPDLRARIPTANSEYDGFIVWNDEVYGDRDGDLMAELPVSRLADGGSAASLAAALSANGLGRSTRFGIRNVARPFADVVFQALPGTTPIHPSEPLRSSDVRPRDVVADYIYFMLHGDDSDARRFWGEAGSSVVEAFTYEQVPQRFTGVVFSGCCWGALTTTRRAFHFAPDERVTCRTSRDSIALRFLAAGSQAFVGCTGVHYSPPGPEPTVNGGPMHVAFFSHLLANEPPARALFLAKQDCMRNLDENARPGSLAISLKIIRQFTCLGLGW